MSDIRESIFRNNKSEIFTAIIRTEQAGVISGALAAAEAARELGLKTTLLPSEGIRIKAGGTVMAFEGTPLQITAAEDILIGLMAKPSGIATAAQRFVDEADGSFEIICGAWKKLAKSVKPAYKAAIETGGCRCRLTDEPMVYLDKNYIIMIGGVDKALRTVKSCKELSGLKTVVQAKGIIDDVGVECWMAGSEGADYLYLDTGRIEDLDVLMGAMNYVPHVPKLIFGGNVSLKMINTLKKYPLCKVGVGKAIMDAPMLDMKLNVVPKKRKCKHEA